MEVMITRSQRKVVVKTRGDFGSTISEKVFKIDSESASDLFEYLDGKMDDIHRDAQELSFVDIRSYKLTIRYGSYGLDEVVGDYSCPQEYLVKIQEKIPDIDMGFKKS